MCPVGWLVYLWVGFYTICDFNSVYSSYLGLKNKKPLKSNNSKKKKKKREKSCINYNRSEVKYSGGRNRPRAREWLRLSKGHGASYLSVTFYDHLLSPLRGCGPTVPAPSHWGGPASLGHSLSWLPAPPPRWGLCPAGSAAGSSAPTRPLRAAPPPRGPRSSQSPVGSKERLSLSLHVPLAPAPQAVRAPCSVVTLIRPPFFPSQVTSDHARPSDAPSQSLPAPSLLPPSLLLFLIPFSRLFISVFLPVDARFRSLVIASPHHKHTWNRRNRQIPGKT